MRFSVFGVIAYGIMHITQTHQNLWILIKRSGHQGNILPMILDTYSRISMIDSIYIDIFIGFLK